MSNFLERLVGWQLGTFPVAVAGSRAPAEELRGFSGASSGRLSAGPGTFAASDGGEHPGGLAPPWSDADVDVVYWPGEDGSEHAAELGGLRGPVAVALGGTPGPASREAPGADGASPPTADRAADGAQAGDQEALRERRAPSEALSRAGVAAADADGVGTQGHGAATIAGAASAQAPLRSEPSISALDSPAVARAVGEQGGAAGRAQVVPASEAGFVVAGRTIVPNGAAQGLLRGQGRAVSLPRSEESPEHRGTSEGRRTRSKPDSEGEAMRSEAMRSEAMRSEVMRSEVMRPLEGNRDRSQAGGAEHRTPPALRVSIGRIEVRVPAPARPVIAAPTAPARTAIRLDDYLAARGRRP